MQGGELVAQPLSISSPSIDISLQAPERLSCISLYPFGPLGAALFFSAGCDFRNGMRFSIIRISPRPLD